VWHKLCDENGFDIVTTDTLRDPGGRHELPITTNVFSAVRRRAPA
jgi:hypothetical protein